MRGEILFLVAVTTVRQPSVPAHGTPLGPTPSHTGPHRRRSYPERRLSISYVLLNESVSWRTVMLAGRLLGESAWIYDSRARPPRGFFDPLTPRAAATRTAPSVLEDSGLAAGSPALRRGGRLGVVWLTTTRAPPRVGYFDADHTRATAQKATPAHYRAGLVVGSSERRSGPGSGSSAWLYDHVSATTTRIGFFDAGYTSADGQQASHAYLVNEAGLVVGNSGRYVGAAYRGPSSWLYDYASATTTRIGLFDAAHTRSDGYTYSDVYYLSESGLAADSRLHIGAARGRSAWIYDSAGATTTRLGCSTRPHRYDGTQESWPTPRRGGLAAADSIARRSGLLGEDA
jgi:hypothetical protein